MLDWLVMEFRSSHVGMVGWVLLMTMLIAAGCSGQKESYQQTLFLTLKWQGDSLKYVDHTVAPTEYSGRLKDDGMYQVQLRDQKGGLVERIGFQPLYFETDADSSKDFTITLPYRPKIFRMMIYRLDGSSGHYTLKGQDPLLDMKISTR